MCRSERQILCFHIPQILDFWVSSFAWVVSLLRLDIPVCPTNLSINEGRRVWYLYFRRVLVLSDMQLVLTRIWTQPTTSTFFDDNHSTLPMPEQRNRTTMNMEEKTESLLYFWLQPIVNINISLMTYPKELKELTFNQIKEKSVRQWSGKPGFNPRSHHTKDFKNGTWYLLA